MDAEFKPKFRPDLTAATLPGSSDIVLKDPISEKFYRLTHYEFRFLRALDGKHTLEEVLEQLRETGASYTIGTARAITSKAAGFGLLLGAGQSARLMRKAIKERSDKTRNLRLISSVYFLFIPILNPDRFLEKTLWIYKLFVNRAVITLMALLAPVAIYLVIVGAERLTNEYLYFFNWRNLFLLWVVIFITKLFHEFSHAYAAKSYGLNVPEMGIAFLIFFPCLYCNTTDAWGLADRRSRMAISAAGIAAEAALAVVSVFVWYFSRPGLINSLAFYLMAVSFISTVLFNGNPLLKFDGYFILIDWLRIPNLASKSMAHLKFLFLNRALGIESINTSARDLRENAIFTVYGVASFIYRFFLYTSIVLGAYLKFDKTLGVALAAMALALFVIRPIFGGLRRLSSLRGEIRPRLIGAIALTFIVGIIGLILFIPWSGSSVFLCYLDSAHKQILTAPMKTRVDKVFVKEGARVERGETLFTLDTEDLEYSLAQALGKRRLVRKEMEFMMVDERRFPDAGKKAVELLRVEDEIDKIKKDLHIAGFELTADFNGRITSLDHRMSRGYSPGEGVKVGELESTDELVAHGLIPAKDLHKVDVGMKVIVWLPIKTGQIYEGEISSVRPYSEKDLKDSPFSSKFGGEVAVEKEATGESEAPLEAYYQCSVRIPAYFQGPYIGMTGYMSVKAPARSIARRIYLNAITVFNRETMF
jgi:putative peptide zinc metalloprotease protein